MIRFHSASILTCSADNLIFMTAIQHLANFSECWELMHQLIYLIAETFNFVNLCLGVTEFVIGTQK